MAYKKIKVLRYDCICERCSHKWISRDDELPESCGKCKSKYWNLKKDKKN